MVVGSTCKSLNSLNLPESLASLNKPAYKSCEPDVSYNPYRPISTASPELLFLANFINGSSTSSVAVLTVVVVPSTCRLPATTKFPEILGLVGKPTVTVLEFSTTSISFAVP